jgi:hypothetical protein
MAEHYVAFWNVENLFDVEDSPRRTDKVKRALGRGVEGWTQSVLDGKVAQLASIIRRMNQGNGPDLLGVCEIENRHVLDLLVAALAPLGRDYRVVHEDTQDNRGIDVAFVYDAAAFTAEDHWSHFIVRRNATRDLLQVNFRSAAGGLLVAIGNHWPSRLGGGPLASEPYRILAAETLAYFHERIREVHGTHTAVLATGDFNDEPFDRSLTEYALSERSPTKVKNARRPAFLNLMWPMLGQGIGTHYYDNRANVLDQFLASKGLVTGASGFTVDASSVDVIRFPEAIGTGDYPVPIRYGRRTFVNPSGFSDHFPIGVKVGEG